MKNLARTAVAMGILSLSAISAWAAEDDPTITRNVSTAIFNEPALRTSQLNISTQKGVVRLSGVVEKAPDVQKATEIASSVTGVVKVQNDFVTVKQ